jgi:hypothetical protein
MTRETSFRHNGQTRNNKGIIGNAVFYSGRPEAIQRAVVESCSKSRVQARSDTPTIAPRVVGGDEKGSLESETVKYGVTRTQE